jgi:hypothetical protein
VTIVLFSLFLEKIVREKMHLGVKKPNPNFFLDIFLHHKDIQV